MDYKKQNENGYTLYDFDKVYPIKKILFNKKLTDIKWSNNLVNYYDDKITIDHQTVEFDQVHLKYLKILGDVSIDEVSLGDGFIVEEAEEITKVFKRNSGWTGADGVYQHQIEDKIHWYFSDTFIGEVDEETRIRKAGFEMVNNTLGISNVDEPFNIQFLVNQKDEQYESFFEPKTEGYYWLQDGIYLENHFYLTVLRLINPIETGMFTVLGVDTLKIPSSGNQLLVDQYQLVPNHFYVKDINRTYTFGASILDDRNSSGYIYVFGYDDELERNSIVSRVKDHLLNHEYEYLTKNGWEKEPKNLRSIAKNVACEYKVIFDNGQYLICYTKNGIGTDIVIGKTEKIEDGFSEFTCVYECRESLQSESIITYNAKLQTFKDLKDLYITYHVNTLINEDHHDANIYYPRWIKLRRRSGT